MQFVSFQIMVIQKISKYSIDSKSKIPLRVNKQGRLSQGDNTERTESPEILLPSVVISNAV
jgi:hypothetical protein